MSDSDRSNKAWERVHKACTGLEPQAIEVLAYIAERLVLGRACYGDLNLVTDKRDFQKELANEAGDLVVYQVCDILQKALKIR